MLAVCIVIGSVSGAVCMPIFIFPAYYLNIKAFIALMRFWSGS